MAAVYTDQGDIYIANLALTGQDRAAGTGAQTFIIIVFH